MEVFGALLCFGATAVAIVWGVVRIVTSPGRKQIESLERTIQDLRMRVLRLEKRLTDGAPDEVHTAPSEPSKAAPAAEAAKPMPRAQEQDAPPPRPHTVPPVPSLHRPPAIRHHPVTPQPAERVPVAPSPPATVPVPVVADVHSPPQQPAEPVAAVRPAAKPEVSLESFIGGRVMLVVGVIVALFGVGFFLKYMIDHDMLGPAARVAIGVAAGLSALWGGTVLRRRGFDVFGQAVMGGGLGALYLSNYFACIRYEFISPTTAFALTAVLTAAGAALAIGRSAPFLAHLGFFGGYLAPLVLGKPTGSLVPLTTWLLLVDAGATFVRVRRAWRGLDVMATAFTTLYVAAWFWKYRDAAELATSCACLAALVAASLVLALAPAILRRVRPNVDSIISAATAGVLGSLGAHDLLFPEHRWALGIGVAALAGAFLLAERLTAARCAESRPESESLLGFAAAALAAAIAMVASGSAVSPALSAAGVALVFAGIRTGHGVLTGLGIGSIGLAAGDAMLFRLPLFDETLRPFLNERFLVFACPCIAMLVSGRLMARAPQTTSAAPLVGAMGLLALPIVLAVDVAIWFPETDIALREMRFVAPVAVLAVYGLLAARLFGRGSAAARAIAFVPMFGALAFGVTLCFLGHRHPFALLVNLTFAVGLLLVVASFGAASSSEAGVRGVLRVGGLVYLLGLLTAELWSWGAYRPLAGFTRDAAELVARDWIAIVWALFAVAVAGLSALRKLPRLAWLGIGDEALERGFALLPFAGSIVWGVAIVVQGHDGPFTRFATLEFAAAAAVFVACHVVARAPFDDIDRIVRVAGYGWLLAAVTCELNGSSALHLLAHLSRQDFRVEVLVQCTIVWAVYAAAIAWMDVARRVPQFAWIGLGADALERGLAIVPLLGAGVWNGLLLLDGHEKAFIPFLNLEFAAGACVIGAAVLVAKRQATSARDVLRIVAAAWLLVLLTVEIRQFGAVCPIEEGTRAEAEFRAIVWISVIWALYASALVTAGFLRKEAGLRWMGLIVFALTLGKVFVVDLAQLESVYRIGSFLVLGVLLVGASFLDQRSRSEAPRDR